MPDWPMSFQVQIALKGEPPRDRDAVDRIVEWLAGGPQAVWSRRLLGATMSRRVGWLITPEDVADAHQDFLCGPARTVAERFDAGRRRSFRNYLGRKLKWFAVDRAERIRDVEDGLERLEQTDDGVNFELVDTADERPDHIAELRAFLSALEAALNKLSPKHREVFLRCVVEGWTHERVALECGTTVPTVGTRLHRARLYLREFLRSGGWADV